MFNSKMYYALLRYKFIIRVCTLVFIFSGSGVYSIMMAQVQSIIPLYERLDSLRMIQIERLQQEAIYYHDQYAFMIKMGIFWMVFSGIAFLYLIFFDQVNKTLDSTYEFIKKHINKWP